MVQQLESVPNCYNESKLSNQNTHEEAEFKTKMQQDPDPQPKPYRLQIVWFNAIGFLILHIIAVYGMYVALTQAKVLTNVWLIFLMHCSGLATTMGAHRLYSHKAFKAKPMIRLLLVLFQTTAGQNCLYIWVRDHRQHHKYSDTNGDPHNSSRGFFFSHIGWLMVRKHPEVISKGKNIDVSDLEADPFVMFQKKYYKTLYVLLAIGMPVAVPMLLWGESFKVSFLVSYILRTIVSLNLTWLVNSYAHMFGTRPFNKTIVPVEAPLVSIFGMGEGWHNYHHAFPWDYKAAELGQRFNVTTWVLDTAAKFGWVYDLRAASHDMVQNCILKKGDGTYHHSTSEEDKQTTMETHERNAFRTPGQ